MAESFTRRRMNAPQKESYPPHYKLMVLLRSRKEMRAVCTGTSVALRVVILCELARRGEIVLNSHGEVVLRSCGKSEIEKEFAEKIALSPAEPRKLIKALNGESKKSLAIRHLRKKVCNEMQIRGILQIKKTILYSKVVLTNNEVWQSIFDEILSECKSGDPSISTIIILIALEYVNRMESLLLQCSETDASTVIKCFEESKEMRFSPGLSANFQLVYQFLNCIINK